MYITFLHKYCWGVQIRGDERGLFEKAKRYRDRGVELFVLERSPSFQEGVGERVYSSLKVKDAPIPPRTLRDIGHIVSSSLLAIMRNRGSPIHPIAIYAYNQDIENVFVGYVLKILTGSKLVVVHHQISPQFVTPFWKSFFARRLGGSRLQTSFFRAILPALNRYSLTHADLHIALSNAAKQDALNYAGITDCRVVGNGLDTKKFRPLNLPKVYDAAFFGRLAPQKGIDVLLRAWRIVVDRHPDAKLILIGGGEERDLQMYRDMIHDLHLENNTVLTGFEDDEEVVKLLNSSKLYVFPSRKEGFAQTVSQAMGCGLCCVLSDIPALTENYTRGAVFAPVDRVESFSDVILSLLKDERRREELGRDARNHVLKLKWEDSVERELSLILAAERQGN